MLIVYATFGGMIGAMIGAGFHYLLIHYGVQ